MIRVMLVEDEPPILRSLKKLIEKIDEEFQVIETANDGEEAIIKLKNNTFDVIFTDIRMPIIDGFGVLSYIQENEMDIIPVILSGYEEFEYARKAIRYNVVDYVLKPFSIENLTDVINKIKVILHDKTKITIMHTNDVSTSSTLEDYSHYSTSQIMASIESYIESSLTMPITHQSLSDKFGFSASYLSKLFKQYRGISPSEYLTKLRIEKAKLLMDDNPEILTKTLAPMVGFSDPFYFSKTFKKITGITPKEYKSNQRNNNY